MKALIKDLIISIAFALLFTRFLFIDVNNVYLGGGEDSFQNAGFIFLATENIKQGKLPFTNTNTFRYPVGFNYQCGFDGVTALMSGVVFFHFLNPTLAYNYTILFLCTLNIFISIVYFRKIYVLIHGNKPNYLLPLIGALMFSVSPYAIARLSNHLNLAFVAGFPVLLYSIMQIISDAKKNTLRWNGLINFFFGLLLCGLGSVQYYLLLLNTIPLIILILLVDINLSPLKTGINRDVLIIIKSVLTQIVNIRNILKVTGTALIFLLIFLFIYSGYIHCFVNNATLFHLWFDKPHILDLFIPNTYLGHSWDFLSFNRKPDIEFVISPGLVVLFLFLYLLSKHGLSRLAKLNTAIYILLAAFAFGAIHMFFVPEGGRITILLSLFLVLLFLYQSPYLTKKVTVFILFLVVVERIFLIVPTSVLENQKALTQIRHYSSTGLLNIPLSIWATFSSSYSAEAWFHGKKIIDGHTHPMNLTAEATSVVWKPPFSLLVCDNYSVIIAHPIEYTGNLSEAVKEIDSFLQKYDVRLVAVHKNIMSNPKCKKVQNTWDKYKNETTIKFNTLYSDDKLEILGY